MTHYELLGVSIKARTDVITLAYKKMARVQHPDKGGNAGKFAELTAAWSILKDEKKRKEYDMCLIPYYRNCAECRGEGRRYKQNGFTSKTMQQCTTCNGAGLVKKV
jgi:DnaJ-class molecular chaperone